MATHDVEVLNGRYDPHILFIDLGDTVTWHWVTYDPKSVTADNGEFDSGLLQDGATFSHKFDSKGNGIFDYHSTIGGGPDHDGMWGSVRLNS